MVKVFLVEDEIVVRNGIKKQINWEEEGIEFIGEASDGELAYPLIQKLKPDIVITDIKMPFMDGLQLSKLIKKEMPWIKIIILSGYNEFDFAKEAICIGITDYLLKPISGVELLEAVVRVRNIIYEEQTEKEIVESYKIEIQKNEKNKYQKFFFDLISKENNILALLEKADELGIKLIAQSYNIVLGNVFIKDEKNYLQGDKVDIIPNISKKMEENTNIYIFHIENEGLAFLVKGQDFESINNETNKIINCFREHLNNRNDIEYFIGVGVGVNRLSELSKSYECASKAFSYRFFVEKNKVIDSRNLSEYRIVKDSGIDIKNIDINKIDKTIVERFLKTGAKNEVRHFLKEYFSNIGEHNIDSFLFCQYIIFDMYFSCVSIMEELEYGAHPLVNLCGDPQSILTAHITLEGAIDYLEKVFQTVIEYRVQNSTKKYTNLLLKAKEYIVKNMANDDISLNSVANHVNVSSNYFSTLFRQETGQNFVEYLTTIRMKKAKELLRCSSMKSSEIAYSVGYKDPHYFSFLFKKTQGVTPKEYRASGKN